MSLTQIDAFAEIGPFRFTAGSLVLDTRAAQDVHNWMVALDRSLAITSPARVRVRIAIGVGVPGRNLGAGNITLESTGADIRIQENISTTGNIILSGVTGGIHFNNRAAKTLSGDAITLTGVVVSNRDLTITASGTLTLNNNITTTASDISAGNLVLTGGTGGIDLGSALTLTGGGNITLTGAIAETANSLIITAVGTLTINSDTVDVGTGALTLTGATIILGSTSRGSEPVGTVNLRGGAITLTATAAESVITVGRFNLSGFFLPATAPALAVTASGVLTIAANIRSVADITLNAGTGGIVIGTATGSSALTWRGNNITLMDAVTTASTAGIDNFTSLTLRASGDLMVGAIDLANGDASAWGDLRLRAGVGGDTTGTITVTTGGSTLINAGSIQFEQDGEVFAAEPATLSIDGVDVGTTSLRSMVLVFYRGSEDQGNVTWGTVIDAGAIVMGTSADPLTTPIMSFNGVLNSRVSITINAGTGDVTFAGTDDITLEAPVIMITAGSINTANRNLTITTNGGTLTLNSNIALTGTGNLTLTSGTIQIARGPNDAAGTQRTLSGANITLTAVDGIQIGRFNGDGEFLMRGGVANLTVTANGVLTIAANITVADDATAGGDIALTGGSIVTLAARERTITGGAITLMGAATGTANLTITASGILTLNSDINLTGAGLTLTLSGTGSISDGDSATVLTASTVSLRAR